jgi:tetratricopeptide (TPR) repeat protein
MSSKQRRSRAKPSERRFPISAEPTSGGDANALVARALGAHQSGRLEEAESLYAQALATDPDHPDALNLSGALAFGLGRPDEAVRLISRAVKVRPDHIDARLNLAEALEGARRVSEAIDACRQALAVAPDSIDAHARLARLLAQRNEAALALAHSRVALALRPDCVEALIARGLALRFMKRSAESETAFRSAIEMAPDELAAITPLAAILQESGRLEEATTLYRQSAELKPDDDRLVAAVGTALELSGDVSGALVQYRRAAELNPASAELPFRCGCCLRDIGRFDEAEAALRAALVLDPDYGPAHLALARLGRIENSPETRRRLSRGISDRTRPPRERAQAGFAYGELLERASEFDGAFLRYAEANAIQARWRASIGEIFNRQELDETVDDIEGRRAAEFAHDVKEWGFETELPVFVVGPARSGTTLVEQICASHSKVVGAGELRSITTAAQVIVDRNQGRERIADWDPQVARSEAEKHAAWLERKAAGASRVIDKSPFNLMRLGFIAGMFPKARVIRCRRDPRDVAVSNHTMFFATGNLWSTDLRDCGHLIRQLDRLGDIWARTLDLSILEIVYEDLVSDLDRNVRRIIDFLGLDWEPECLRFHESDRQVRTPSSWQVRQPINSKSVGRWKRFEGHLGPLFEALAGKG